MGGTEALIALTVAGTAYSAYAASQKPGVPSPPPVPAPLRAADRLPDLTQLDAQRAKRLAAAGAGRAGTILTSPLSASTDPNAPKKQLLGE